ncbi:hypothetical protein [Metabacillus fastidiosus]|uniref:Transcriptional repressor NrdR-like N-terminal domain-containing protein n=1 Tax=Metabacillus fastidiosus TaxID=1458 RepID=A0ABU6NRP2_9BACI|nr:hypothetical protein [Metabacillus fastidiosus]
MKCPLCSGKLFVTDSKTVKDRIRRVRECKECLSRFPNYEIINLYECDPYIRRQLERKKAL